MLLCSYHVWAISQLLGGCTGDRAANLDLCLALTALSSKGSFTCHTYNVLRHGTSIFKVISGRPVILFFVLSINTYELNSYVNSIYPGELEIKDTTESSTSATYLEILLNIDANRKLTTYKYDKRDYFNFAIVNFPYIYSNISLSPAYGVYICQLSRYARTCSTYDQFLNRG
jgi:hypothetical protein